MTRTVQVTKEGLGRLQGQLEEERRRLAEATDILQEMTGTADDQDDSGMEDARQEKARLEARVEELEDQLGRAVVIEGHTRTQVDLGATVTLRSGTEALRVQLVSPVEVEVASEPPHISDASPLGQALLGRKVGDTFTLEAGGRSTDYEVSSID